MAQGHASVSEETKINTLMSMGYSRADADGALWEAHGDVGEAMVLLANRSPPPGGARRSPRRERRVSSRDRSRRSHQRQVGTQAFAATLENPYAKAVMTESAKMGLSYILPPAVGTMVTQMIDVYLKGSDDSGVEDIKRRVEDIERRVEDIEIHVGIPTASRRARLKKNKSKKKDKSKRKKRKTKRKPKK